MKKQSPKGRVFCLRFFGFSDNGDLSIIVTRLEEFMKCSISFDIDDFIINIIFIYNLQI